MELTDAMEKNSATMDINPRTFRLIAQWGLRECRLQNPGKLAVGGFGGNGVPKESLQPGEHEEIPCIGSSRHPPGVKPCGDSTGQSTSRLALMHIIINKKV
jgi:hypothetical protein